MALSLAIKLDSDGQLSATPQENHVITAGSSLSHTGIRVMNFQIIPVWILSEKVLVFTKSPRMRYHWYLPFWNTLTSALHEVLITRERTGVCRTRPFLQGNGMFLVKKGLGLLGSLSSEQGLPTHRMNSVATLVYLLYYHCTQLRNSLPYCWRKPCKLKGISN